MKTCVKENPLRLGAALAYALPVGATSILYGGPLVVLQGVYAKHYGVSLAAIASILLFVRLFDTITDPLIGYWSDQYYARKGTRKPFVLLGAILFIVSAYFLFSPPGSVSLVSLTILFLVFYLGYTLFNIPHYAWGSELCSDSHSSTRLFTIRAAMMSAGLLVFYALSLLPFFDSTEITPELLRWAVIFAGIVLLPCLYLCLVYVPTSYSGSDSHATRSADSSALQAKKASNFLSLWRNVRHNKPFLIFLSAFILWGVGIGCWGGLLYIFIDAYLGMGEHFSLAALIGVGVSLVTVPIWSRLARRLGKIIAWVISSLVTASSMLLMFLMDPANPSFIVLVVAISLAYLGSLSFMIFAPALLSDIIDYGQWKTGGEFSASYFSIFLLAAKGNEAVGVALSLSLAGYFGFDPSHTEHSSNAVWGLKFAGIWLPLIFFLLSTVIIAKIPITTRRHTVIRKALARRESRPTIFPRRTCSSGKPQATITLG